MGKMIAAVIVAAAFLSLALIAPRSVQAAPVPVDDAPAEVKVATPTVTKEVANKPARDAGPAWKSEVTANPGDTVLYRAVAALPVSYDTFSAYHLAFVDQRDQRLIVDESSLRIHLVDANLNELQDVTEAFTVSVTATTITATAEDLRQAVPSAASETKLVLSYQARVSDDTAESQRLPNYVHVEYTREPRLIEGTAAAALGDAPLAAAVYRPATTLKPAADSALDKTPEAEALVRTPAADSPAQPNKSEQQKTTLFGIPKTGDTNLPLAGIITIAIAGAAAIAVGRLLNKRP